MKFLEKDLEEIIFESYKKDYGKELNLKGLLINGTIKKQLKIGNYGIADLVTFKRDIEEEFIPELIVNDEIHSNLLAYSKVNKSKLTITVYELKKDKIGISAMLQAIRYAKGIKDYLENRCFVDYIDFEIALIGREIDISGSFCYLPDLFPKIRFYTYKYGLNGLVFKKEEDYSLSKKGF